MNRRDSQKLPPAVVPASGGEARRLVEVIDRPGATPHEVALGRSADGRYIHFGGPSKRGKREGEKHRGRGLSANEQWLLLR